MKKRKLSKKSPPKPTPRGLPTMKRFRELMKGVEACREVKGREKQDTIMTGMSTACAAVTNGRMESIDCSMTQPVKIQCR